MLNFSTRTSPSPLATELFIKNFVSFRLNSLQVVFVFPLVMDCPVSFVNICFQVMNGASVEELFRLKKVVDSAKADGQTDKFFTVVGTKIDQVAHDPAHPGSGYNTPMIE